MSHDVRLQQRGLEVFEEAGPDAAAGGRHVGGGAGGLAKPQAKGIGSEAGDLGGAGSPTTSAQKLGAALEAMPLPLGRVTAVEASPEAAPKRRRSRDLGRQVVKGAKVTARYVVKVAGVTLMTVMLGLAVFRWPPWVIADEDKRLQVMSAMFVVGLFSVAVEEVIGMNKSAMMLCLAATMWTFLAVGYRPLKSEEGAHKLHEELSAGLEEVGSVILFLLPAMGVVESIDHFDGFAVVNLAIRKGMAGHQDRLLPIICVFTFALSSVIDNLTSTIVALKILKHLAPDKEHRHFCGGLAVLAANAGGVWSPVGDVTTTMLWIQGKITASATMKWLLLPSLTAGLLPLAGLWYLGPSANRRDVRGADDGGIGGGWSLPESRRRHVCSRASDEDSKDEDWDKDDGSYKENNRHGKESEALHILEGEGTTESGEGVVTPTKVIVFVSGITMILMVPVLKIMTALPPYLGMLLALGVVWLLTDAIGATPAADGLHGTLIASPRESEGGAQHPHGPPQSGVVAALHKLDLTGLLFFTGILLVIGALDSAGVLMTYATGLVRICQGNTLMLCTLLGISSAVVDNVPLVQASIDMFYDTPADDLLWQLVALAAGTGGSILSIGSIAGVTLMSMENVSFMWYLRYVAPWATASFFAGLFVYQAERWIFA